MDFSASAIIETEIDNVTEIETKRVDLISDHDDDGDGLNEPKIPKKRARKQRSDVWDFFDNLPLGSDGKERSECKACKKAVVSCGNKYGTSTLQRHRLTCDKIPKGFANTEVGKLMLDHNGKLKSRKVDFKVVREMISMAIIEHDLPFSFVEYRRVRELFKYLNP